MDLGNVDRSTLKSVIKEILKEDITLFKEVIREILTENQVITSKDKDKKRKMLEMMINENFNKYEDVFKALA